jgi:hypothetical protein
MSVSLEHVFGSAGFSANLLLMDSAEFNLRIQGSAPVFR